MSRTTASVVLLGLLTVLMPLDDAGAQRYPSRPVRTTVPTPLGGPGNIIAPSYNFTFIRFQSSMTRSA